MKAFQTLDCTVTIDWITGTHMHTQYSLLVTFIPIELFLFHFFSYNIFVFIILLRRIIIIVSLSSVCLDEVERRCVEAAALKLPITTARLSAHQLRQLFQVSCRSTTFNLPTAARWMKLCDAM